jgi:hypothetical protein
MDILLTRRRRMALALIALLAGLPAAASAQLQCRAGTLEFYPGGALKGCEIDANHRFYTARGDAIHCVSGGRVTQYPSGEVQSCTIDRPHTFTGVRCETPGRVELARDGTLLRCGQPG